LDEETTKLSVEKQSQLKRLDEKLRTAEKTFNHHHEVRSAEKVKTDAALRQKYEKFLRKHDEERKARHVQRARKQADALSRRLQEILDDVTERKKIYDEGAKQAHLIFETMSSCYVPPVRAAPRKGRAKDPAALKQWEKWKTNVPKSAEEGERSEEELEQQEKHVLSHIRFGEAFKYLEKFRQKAGAELKKDIHRREKELEGFYLPFIAQLALRATETSKALFYETTLHRKPPPISIQTYSQILDCLGCLWDFLKVPESARSDVLARCSGK